jgi:DNA-binding NarL/FixJ family response regulator
MNPLINVLLVDDHLVVREGYKQLLEKANIKVIAEASNGEEAYGLFDTITPDVTIMDISMPGISGIETIKKVKNKYPKSKILAFSMHDDIIFTTRAIEAGASGYVTKSSAPTVLVEAVRTVFDNKRYISPDLAKKIALNGIKDMNEIKNLSDREFEVFRLLASGMSLDEISVILSLDYKTIANIQSRIKYKLKIENKSQLILAAIKFNILIV